MCIARSGQVVHKTIHYNGTATVPTISADFHQYYQVPVHVWCLRVILYCTGTSHKLSVRILRVQFLGQWWTFLHIKNVNQVLGDDLIVSSWRRVACPWKFPDPELRFPSPDTPPSPRHPCAVPRAPRAMSAQGRPERQPDYRPSSSESSHSVRLVMLARTHARKTLEHVQWYLHG